MVEVAPSSGAVVAAGSDEPYGFERLEESLARHRNGSAGDLRRGILTDLEAYTGGGERDDDLTLLVLRFPWRDEESSKGDP